MSGQSGSGTSGEGSGGQEGGKSKVTHVTLAFDRPLTDDEVKQMQMQHKAISAVKGGGHHDHDHPTLA